MLLGVLKYINISKSFAFNLNLLFYQVSRLKNLYLIYILRLIKYLMYEYLEGSLIINLSGMCDQDGVL
jgi:hypothetical protein